MRERELKLLAASDLVLPDPDELLDGVGSWTIEELDLDAVYFDTSDLRLTRSGVSLRHRSDDGWTVKLPEPREGQALVRTEHVFSGELGDPPAAALELVRAWARSSPLSQVAQIRSHRRKLHVYDSQGRALGEIDDDAVTGTSTRHHTFEFREIEVENAEGADPAALKTVVKRIRNAGAGTARPMPKVARALGASASMPPDLRPPEPLGRNATVGQLVRAAIAGSVQRLIDHDPVIRLSEDPEAIHQARVATRRLRSDLRTFRPVLDVRWSEPLRAELRWLGEELGHVRDADVLLDRLEAKASEVRMDEDGAATMLMGRLRGARRATGTSCSRPCGPIVTPRCSTG